MDPPAVQYVRASDGYDIAYGVSGHGRPLVFIPGVFNHVQLGWQYAGLQPWLEGLAARFRLVQLDPRGTGMSSRGLTAHRGPVDFARDVEVVVDRLNLDRFVLFGFHIGAGSAVSYAVDHPERVDALVLGAPQVSMADSPFLKALAMFEYSAQDWESFLYSTVPRDYSAEDARLRVELLKQAFDQDDFLLISRAFVEQDELAEQLTRLKPPILVLHPSHYALLAAAEAMKVAQLCGGRMVLLDGTSVFGDADQGIRALESFLADLPAEDIGVSLPPGGLSSRETEVLRLVAAGKSNPQIAAELVISLNTVQRHVSNILAKTGPANRTEAAGYARDKGLL